MASIPQPTNSTIARIDEYCERSLRDYQRLHLGCSQIGHPCDRYLWLAFRWAVSPSWPGRVARIFRRGKAEEATVVADLRAIGVDVRCTGEQQLRVDFGGHIAGSVDGIIEGGLPEAPKKKHVLEIKTHNLHSFETLVRVGVKAAKPAHWVQMQLYMHGTGIDKTFYFAVCKDDDRIYTERVQYDAAAAEQYLERARRIVFSDRMPDGVSNAAICDTCQMRSFCHETRMTDQVHCRTCAFAKPCEGGAWHCARYSDNIPADFQHQGCEAHAFHSDLVPWQEEPPSKSNPFIKRFLVDGLLIQNGEPDGRTFSSRELVVNLRACLEAARAESTEGDFIATIRAETDGRIVG